MQSVGLGCPLVRERRGREPTATAAWIVRRDRHESRVGFGPSRRIAGVVLFGLVGAVQASPVAAEGGGYSAAARACQEGYSTLVGVQDGAVTTFDTPGACVAYAAGGGQLVVPPTWIRHGGARN